MLALYGIGLLLPESVVASLFSVATISAAIAAVTLVASIVLYFVHPKDKPVFATFISYALIAATVASVVVTTGESHSPLVGLWIAISVFAGVFGWGGYLLIAALLIGYNLFAYFSHSSVEAIITATVITIAPLVASFIIWHSKSKRDVKQDKAYKELASELNHEANKSDVVINAINDGVVAIDSEGVIQLINPAAQRIIGWGKNDAVGLSYKSVVKLRDKTDKPITEGNDPVAQVFATNQEVHSEDFSFSTEAGKKILLSLVVSPLGQPATGAIMVFRDMTKEKSEGREQAEFISTASHEMRTPVASIEGYLGLALNPATATIDEKARDYIQKAQSSAQHLGRLFQDLLDVTQADDGRLNNNQRVVDVSVFVGDVAEGLKPKATEKGLRFIYKPGIDSASENERKILPVYYAHVDNDHLREVVANLIENAIKYTLQGDVIINVTGDDSHVTISVQDSGIGIPAEDIPHLFQKFYRVDNSDTREIGGTGLGLYLCRRLAELMGGRMTVESVYRKGSTFSLVLPRLESSEATRLMEEAAVTEQATIQFDPPQEQLPSINNTTAPPVADSAVSAIPAVTTASPPPAPVVQPQSLPAAQPQTAPVAPQPVTPQTPNVPLTQLERNPAAYTAARPGMRVPIRTSDDTKQA